jgi:acetyltransferase-like isoleucine patch superfamily enzyme
VNGSNPRSLSAALHETWNTPWKARNEIERLLLLPLAWMSCAGAGVGWGPGWKLYGLPILQIHRESRVRIGSRLQLRSWRRSNPLGPHHPCILCTWQAGAELVIGDDFGMTGGSIVCAERVTIGNRVFVGCNATITDTDFHPLSPQARSAQPQSGTSAPILIDDDVFIGMHALVLKGVHLGAGCVVGAGSVVTRDVPAGAVAAGNPARIIGTTASS